MKKSFAVLLVIGLVSFVPPQTEKKVKLELSIPQTELVVKALRKLPYDESAETINVIVGQALSQLNKTDTIPKKK